MHSPQAHAALELLTQTASKLSDDFSGLGIVFYDSLSGLPFLPLEITGTESFDLPISSLTTVSNVLVQAARRSSHWHDGFHFVRATSLTLTHLCQFIAPPLPDTGDAMPRASGARHMTALLTSKVSGVIAVGLLTQGRIVSIYESGALTLYRTLS